MICLTCHHYTHPDRELAQQEGSARCRCACHPWVPRDAASVRIWWEDTPDPERPLWAYLVWETDADGWHDVAHGWLSEDALNADTDAELIAVFRAECPRYASIPDERITIQ